MALATRISDLASRIATEINGRAKADSNKTKIVLPSLEGLMLTAYGHSYIDGTFRPNNIGPAQRYVDRVASRLGLVMDNNGVAGYHMQDSVLDALGSRDATKTFTPGETGIGVIDCITNDAGTFGSTATALLGYEISLRALIWWLSTDPTFVKDSADPMFTYAGNTGAWTDLTNADYYKGTLKQLSQTLSGTMTFTISTPGRYAIAFATLPQVRDMELLIDGVVTKTWATTGGQLCSHTGPAGQRQFTSFVGVFDVPSGSHTIVLRNKAGGTTNTGALIDYVSRLNTVNPMQIFVPKAVPWPGGGAGIQATIDLYNARMASVVAEFANAHVVDTVTGFNMGTMIGTDQVHLNPAGNEFYADKFVNAIRAWYGV